MTNEQENTTGWSAVEQEWGCPITTVNDATDDRMSQWMELLTQMQARTTAGTQRKDILFNVVTTLALMPRELVIRHFGTLRTCVVIDGRVNEAGLPRMDILKKIILSATEQAKVDVTWALANRQIEKGQEDEAHWASKFNQASSKNEGLGNTNETKGAPMEEMVAGIAAAAAKAVLEATAASKARKPMRKLKELPSFDGTPEKVHDFIITLMSVEGDDEEEKLSNIKSVLPGMLEGAASAWLPIARHIHSLSNLYDSLLTEYSGKSTIEHFEDFSRIRRKSSETCWDFWARCKNTRTAINATSPQTSIAEGTMIRAFRRGLGQGYESLSSALFARSTTTMQQVVEVMNEWSSCLQEKGADPHGIYATAPTSPNARETSLLTAISELTATLQQRPPAERGNTPSTENPPFNQRYANSKCYECGRKGHLKVHHYRNPRGQSSFRTNQDRNCKRCGQDGHTSPWCEAPLERVKTYQQARDNTPNRNSGKQVQEENMQLRNQLETLQKQMQQLMQSQGVATIAAEAPGQQPDFREARTSL